MKLAKKPDYDFLVANESDFDNFFQQCMVFVYEFKSRDNYSIWKFAVYDTKVFAVLTK